MSHNTHSTVGQIAGRCVVLRARAEARATSHQSPVTGHRSLRSGISLTEVLIAMGILTVGLLGVAAIFPVAGFYMQKGEVADRGAAIAQAAYNELITRGMLNPESWQEVAWNDGGGGVYPQITGIDGMANAFARPISSGMNADLARLTALNLSAEDIQLRLARRFGSAFVIDPLGVAGSTSPGGSAANRFASAFPTSAYPNGIYSNTTPWRTWWPGGLGPGDRGNVWPVRRVTLKSPDLTSTFTSARMDVRLADTFFSNRDDLALDMPAGNDKPSIQKLDLSSTDLNGDGSLNDVLARSSRGDYSWLATIVPTTASAWRALASGVSKHAYEVSVVVFHKRVVTRVAPQSSADAIAAVQDLMNQERIVKASVVSTGLSGGELLLERIASDANPESVFQGLKTGNWIMVCAPHPASSNREPLFVLRWYRVLAIEGKDRRLNADGTYAPAPASSEPERRLVTLRGPQWPWQPAASPSAPDELSNNLCVGIIPGAVAVHSKTVRLEGNSVWSGGASELGSTASPWQNVLR